VTVRGSEDELTFDHPVVIVVPKFQWEQRADFLLFEFYRDR
jgi:hypothetical protein